MQVDTKLEMEITAKNEADAVRLSELICAELPGVKPGRYPGLEVEGNRV
ncbi:MAG: hypothetical protein IJI68_08710 [Eggerthellaceae bacterium]|nr:hypothetical protein [Eggerthellaceae bacterium]